MTGTLSDPLRDRDEEAALWCMALSDGSMAPEERAEFELWMEDPDNAAALQDQAALWDLTEAAANYPSLIRHRVRALDEFREANERRWAPEKRRPKWLYLGGGITAVAAALLLAFMTLMSGNDQAVRYFTGVGERRIAMLEDGSRLTLDAATAVDVKLTPQRRMLTVSKGRAKFDVSKDPLRPFSVQANGNTVVAVGTSFSVETLGKAVSVVLYEGQVTILRGAKRKGSSETDTLTAGRSMLIGAAGEVSVKPVASDRSLAWTSGQLDFTDEPLSTAVERMNRYIREPIVVGRGVSPSIRVTGVFNAGDANAFVEGVAALNGLQISREVDRVVLHRG